MDVDGSVPPTGGDGLPGRGSPSRRQGGGGFFWAAPSPSPADIEGLERRFSEIIQLPTAVLDRELEDWSASGVIARALSRWVPPEAVIREFRRAGLAGRIDVISLAHRTLLMKFELPVARCAALLQPWIVNGQPLAVEPWRPDFIPADDALRSALLWIRLPNLPIEYWNEESLRSILSVAGEFVDADVFTKEKRRGSFARACVRVDLSKPLRPGARFRGFGVPFWQQFMYEHVDCICSSCGSIHLLAPCSASPEQGSSAAAPLFGPWMAALRQRKASPVKADVGCSSGPAVAEEPSRKGKAVALGDQGGWRKPIKVSKRRSVPLSSLPNVAFVHSGIMQESGPCRDSQPVPVTVHPDTGSSSAAAMASGDSVSASVLPSIQKTSKGAKRNKSPAIQSIKKPSKESIFQFKAKDSSAQALSSSVAIDVVVSPQKENQLPEVGKVAANPFTLVGSDRWAGCPKVREDANPGSLKRPRAAEFIGPRLPPKPLKGKCRVTSSSKGPSLPQGKDAHDMAFSSLKDALAASPADSKEVDSRPLDQSGVDLAESAQQPALLVQVDCQLSDQGLLVPSPASGDTPEMVMSGSQGET